MPMKELFPALIRQRGYSWVRTGADGSLEMQKKTGART